MRRIVPSRLRLALASACLAACGDDADTGTGSLSVLIEAEDSITAGLDPGDDEEGIQDGWQVRFDRYLLTVGEIELELASDRTIRAGAGELFVVDLVSIPQSGLSLWNLDGLSAGRWEFLYSIGGGSEGPSRHESVTAADFEAVVENDWTYLISGNITSAEGRSCPPERLAAPPVTATAAGDNVAGDSCYASTEVAFTIGINAEISFGPCEIDGVGGVGIAAGGAQTVAATIHGDHLFFNGFPEGDEGGVERRAQWLADSDLDLDGNVTQQELESLIPSDLAEVAGYDLGGSPINPLDNMWTYVRAQLATQGHMDGEGECPPGGVPDED